MANEPPTEPALAEPLRAAMTELVRAAGRARATGRRLVGWRPEASPT